jgi:uncharacterized OB-fold protein
MNGRPMPSPSPLTAGFWDAARRHELVVQRCECGRYRHYPQLLCPDCNSASWAWASQRPGTVYTFTVTYRAFHPAWATSCPTRWRPWNS